MNRIRHVSIHRHPAFSLLEVVLVMTMMAIMLGLTAPRMQSYIEHDRVRRLGGQIALDLAMARSEAIKLRTPVKVKFRADGNFYRILIDGDIATIRGRESDYEVLLKRNDLYNAEIRSVEIDTVTDIEFDRFGRPNSGGVIVIGSGDSEVTITIDQATGNVTVGKVAKAAETL
ncbi:MAG: GspH/FimT family pseudopilin [Planctomycetes bacterium]|nr:GspH/FimT family pseudopilin [Planctomycetota bacterium]